MKLFGCLLLLVLVGAYGVCEWWLGPALVASLLTRAFPEQLSRSGLLESYTLMVIMSIVGIWLAKRHIAAIPAELAGSFMGGPAGGGLGQRVVKLVGAVLLAIPGFFSGALGILLMIPPLPWLFAKAGTVLGMSLARVAMKRMMGGAGAGGGPFAGGIGGMAGFSFPGAGGAGSGPGARGGFPFPGMMPADDSIPMPKKRGKTYDVSAEKDHPKLKD